MMRDYLRRINELRERLPKELDLYCYLSRASEPFNPDCNIKDSNHVTRCWYTWAECIKFSFNGQLGRVVKNVEQQIFPSVIPDSAKRSAPLVKPAFAKKKPWSLISLDRWTRQQPLSQRDITCYAAVNQKSSKNMYTTSNSAKHQINLLFSWSSKLYCVFGAY